MENNLKNKALFFAQYFGQNILSNHYRLVNGFPNETVVIEDRMLKTWCLVLKSTINISEEDLEDLAILINPKGEIPVMMKKLIAKEVLKYMDGVPTNISIEEPNKLLLIFDFLRSRGYAIPFMGLDVMEMVHRFWIALD